MSQNETIKSQAIITEENQKKIGSQKKLIQDLECEIQTQNSIASTIISTCMDDTDTGEEGSDGTDEKFKNLYAEIETQKALVKKYQDEASKMKSENEKRKDQAEKQERELIEIKTKLRETEDVLLCQETKN